MVEGPGHFVIITAVGEDRPGIIAALSREIYELGGNIEDSSMTILKGDFAMILTVQFPKTLDWEELAGRLKRVEENCGLLTSHRLMPELESRREREGETNSYIISVYGADKPGILYGVSDHLARHSINITDLRTNTLAREGVPVYVMILEVDVPPETDWELVNAELTEICRRLAVDVTVQALDETIL